MGRVSKKISWEIAKKIFLPFILLVVIGYPYFLTYTSKMARLVSPDTRRVLNTLLVAGIAFFLHRALSAFFVWYRENIADKTATQLDNELIPLMNRSSKVLLWVIALLVILPFYGINISALITTLGVSSLAIALAAQDTIANIIAGFMIMIDKPFRLQDRIRLPSGEVVTVIDIGVRRSRFLAEDGAVIIVPNLELSKSKIVNYTYGEERTSDAS